MIDQLAALARQLKGARERKGLNQRVLASKVGIPQGHISRIERAEVDLQTTSLIQLARVLDLELVLVPRRALPAVEFLSRDSVQRTSAYGQDSAAEPVVMPAYTLDDEED